MMKAREFSLTFIYKRLGGNPCGPETVLDDALLLLMGRVPFEDSVKEVLGEGEGDIVF